MVHLSVAPLALWRVRCRPGAPVASQSPKRSLPHRCRVSPMNLLFYSYRNMLVRWKSTLMTAAAFALVFGAFVVMVAFVDGVLQTCRVSGQPENVIVLRKGIDDEI